MVAIFRHTRRVERREILRDRARCLVWLGPSDSYVTRHTLRLVDVRLDQTGVDRERLAANQANRDAGGYNPLEHAAEHLALAEALVPGAREDRVVRDRVLDAQTTKPAIRQIDLNLRTDPSLRPDRKDVAEQQHAEHQFRVDRGTSGVAVERRKLLVEFRERCRDERSCAEAGGSAGYVPQAGTRRTACPDPAFAVPSSPRPRC